MASTPPTRQSSIRPKIITFIFKLICSTKLNQVLLNKSIIKYTTYLKITMNFLLNISKLSPKGKFYA